MRARCEGVCCRHSRADPCRGLASRSRRDRGNLRKESKMLIGRRKRHRHSRVIYQGVTTEKPQTMQEANHKPPEKFLTSAVKGRNRKSRTVNDELKWTWKEVTAV